MRFAPEMRDGPNVGLDQMQAILQSIKDKHPGVSCADIWTLAGAEAIKASGGPEIPFNFGRTDAAGPESCPPNGRLLNPLQDAQHLRDVLIEWVSMTRKLSFYLERTP